MKLLRLAAALGTLGFISAAGVTHAAPGTEAPVLVAVQPPVNAGPAPTSPALALAALDRKIADLDAEEQNAKRELGSLGQKIAETKGRAHQRGRAFYKISRAGMLPMGGGFDALVTHAMRVERARRALGMDLEEERKLRSRGAELSHVLERVARDRVSLSGQRSAMDAARVAMADEARRQDAFEKAFAPGGGASDYVAVYGGNGASLENKGGFASSRGRLLFPVIGRAEVRSARREGTDGPGLEVRAQVGTAVRAVFAGRVVFADRYGPYGRLVILDHGDHYYSVSGNLASIDVRVGSDVSAGERLGSVGDEGHGAMLYFELRRGGETIAPAPWLGISAGN